MRSWEHEAMKIKYECQMPITIRVEVREDKDPSARTKNVISEAESAVKFRREWDATEDEIEGKERI